MVFLQDRRKVLFFLIDIGQEREENCRESDTFETLVASLRQSYHISSLGRSMLSSSSTARTTNSRNLFKIVRTINVNRSIFNPREVIL